MTVVVLMAVVRLGEIIIVFRKTGMISRGASILLLTDALFVKIGVEKKNVTLRRKSGHQVTISRMDIVTIEKRIIGGTKIVDGGLLDVGDIVSANIN